MAALRPSQCATLRILMVGSQSCSSRARSCVPEEAVREARGREIGLMGDHGMYDIFARGAARGKLVRAKWLDDWGKNGMRSRLVAQQVNLSKLDDVTQKAPPLVAARLLVVVWTQGRCRGTMFGWLGLQCRFLSRTGW